MVLVDLVGGVELNGGGAGDVPSSDIITKYCIFITMYIDN